MTGVWDWVFRSTDEQKNVRIEQEEWHLQQRGKQLSGWYDRAVTMMSTDEMLFRCNRQLGFTKFTRVRIAGTVEGEGVRLREVGFEARPGPCDDGARNLVKYTGKVLGATIYLKWDERGGGQTLHRREGAQPALAETVGAEDVIPVEPARQVVGTAPVTGDWEWQLRSIDAEGDERLEREEWHLAESDAGIAGWYERTVTRARGEGTFACNGEARYLTVTRYAISGSRAGDRVSLSETEYKSAPSRCDNGLRRLDSYRGTLSADGGELSLSWGPGTQLLRRKK